MGRGFVILAGNTDEAKSNCEWDLCSTKHDSPIQYLKGGITVRDEYNLDKLDRHNAHLLGRATIKNQYSGPIYIAFQRLYMGNTISSHPNPTTDNDFPVQYHHVIPLKAMKGFTRMRFNLELLNWNINDERNLIVLPFNYEDMKRHDLQTHRTNHPSYNKDVKNSLKELDIQCEHYCKDDEPDQLLEEVEEIIDVFVDYLVNWLAVLHPKSLLFRHLPTQAIHNMLGCNCTTKNCTF